MPEAMPTRLPTFFLLCLGCIGLSAQTAFAQDELRIALVSDGPDLRPTLAARLKDEVVSVLSSNRPTELAPTLEGTLTAESAKEQLETALADPQVDAVIALGLYVAQALIDRTEPLPKPVVLAEAAPELQDLPLDKGASGRTNFTYVTGLLTLERDLRRLKEVAPFEHIALLVDRRATDALPRIPKVAEAAAREVEVEATVVPCDPDVQAILKAIPERAQAVYLTVLPGLTPSQRTSLIEQLTAQKRIVFSMEGKADVEAGAFASLTSEKDPLRRARRVALLLERILVAGEDAAQLRVGFRPEEQLLLNRSTAKRLGLSPGSEILLEAEMADDYDPTRGEEKLDIRGAVAMAVRRNRDVDVGRRAVDVQTQTVKGARGRWLPQVDGNAAFDWIDPDVASPFGSAERTFSWGIQGRQTLYSRDDYAELGTQKQRLRGIRADLSTRELDTGADAAIAYLEVLRAEVATDINAENLERTRENLHLAEARVGVGAGARDEVYRWQAEVANRQSDVLVAMADRERARVTLNRVLNHPLEQQWQLADTKMADLVLPLTDEATMQYLSTEEGYRQLRNFLVERAMDRSPRLRSLDASIEAQQVVLSASRQRFFAPDVAAIGGFTHQPGTWGEGAGEVSSTGGIDFPPRDTFSWSLGVQANLPLFSGNQRTAAVRGAAEELGRLRAERANVAQRIDESVRRASLSLMGTYPSVKLSRQASKAANKNLEVITDKYRRGASDIVRLIDAQNQALLADLAAAEAVYRFLIDWVETERSTGELMFVRSASEREALLQQLKALTGSEGS